MMSLGECGLICGYQISGTAAKDNQQMPRQAIPPGWTFIIYPIVTAAGALVQPIHGSVATALRFVIGPGDQGGVGVLGKKVC